MSNLDILKRELQAQKKAIENKGGTVHINAINPTPTEITAGIDSIFILNTSSANATEKDVKLGKTFYSGNNELKTGTFESMDDETLISLVCPIYDTQSLTKRFSLTIPEGRTQVRPYIFYRNANPIDITLNTDIESIGSYAFSKAPNINIANLGSLTNCKLIEDHAFDNTFIVHPDDIPPNVEELESYSFFNSIQEHTSINIPSCLKVIGNYSFAQESERKYMQNLNLSNYTGTGLPSYVFSLLHFDCDLIIPPSVTTVYTHCFYRGSVNKAIFHENFTYISDTVFGGLDTDPVDAYNLQYLEFKSVKPPRFAKDLICVHHITNGCKIYVPDNSVEAYKAVSYLSQYVNYILPASQKP